MVKKTVLDSGLVIISEYIPAFPSFALSYSLRTASREETRENNGIFHFIEHMLFKGSEKYDMKKIADVSDRLGGQLNAFTGKEITQYYIKAIDEKLEESFDLLTDMVMKSTFPEDEFLKEKHVLVQEINESEDNPDTHAFETFYEDLFEDDGLGLPIAGKEEVVSTFKRDMVYDFYKQSYTPDNLVLAGVGNVKHDDLVRLATAAFKAYPGRAAKEIVFTKPSFTFKQFCQKNESLKQLYAITGFAGLPSSHPLRHRFAIMNDILGGGMSSRLYQEIREEKGLAYTVSSFTDSYHDLGIQIIYSIVERDKVNEYLDAVANECARLKKDGITKAELDRSRDHIKASIILGMESSISRMRYHLNHELGLQREVPISEIVEDLNNTTVDDINQLFRDYMDLDNTAFFLYGDIDEDKLEIAN